MGWVISVGRAGAKGKQGSAPALALVVDTQRAAGRVKVFPDVGRAAIGDASAAAAWQAQRVWQNVLSTLVGA